MVTAIGSLFRTMTTTMMMRTVMLGQYLRGNWRENIKPALYSLASILMTRKVLLRCRENYGPVTSAFSSPSIRNGIRYEMGAWTHKDRQTTRGYSQYKLWDTCLSSGVISWAVSFFRHIHSFISFLPSSPSPPRHHHRSLCPCSSYVWEQKNCRIHEYYGGGVVAMRESKRGILWVYHLCLFSGPFSVYLLFYVKQQQQQQE